MERIKDQYNLQTLNGKLNEISQQEMIQKGLIFVNSINEIYILCQQQKKIFQEEDQSIQQLQQSEEQVKQIKERLNQAEKQLEQAKKKLEPAQENLNLINKQETLLNKMFISNKAIILQKFIAK